MNNTSFNEKPLRNIFYDQSLWFLLLSNITTIYFAITENWNLSTIMWVYWFQSITIGFFNFIRIIQLMEFSTEGFKINGQPALPTQTTKFKTAIFFLIHYGMFHFVYFMYLFRGTSAIMDGNIQKSAEVTFILPIAVLFFLNHLFSYIYNRPHDTQKQNIGTLMFYPYARILPMHITIIFGTSFVDALPLFLVLKTLADAIMHVVEHNVLIKGEKNV